MSQTVEIDYLDGNFTVIEEEPSTIAECVTIIGEDGVVAETTSNLRYRNKYPRVYGKVSEAVAKGDDSRPAFPKLQTGTKTKKAGGEVPVFESDNDHLRAFWQGRKDESGTITNPAPEGNKAILQSLFDLIATGEPLYVKGERAAGGAGKVSQAAINAANEFFAKGPDQVDKVVAHVEGSVSGLKVVRDDTGEVTSESLARALQAYYVDNKRKADAKAKAELALALW